MAKSIRTCLFCKLEFYAENKEINRGAALFCSRQCRCKAYSFKPCVSTKSPNCICPVCEKSFYRSPSKLANSKRSGLHFCSSACANIGRRIESGLIIRHDSTNNLSSYRSIAFRNKEHKCESCGYSDYIEILQVHHKDLDRGNNTVSNLQILCPTCHEVTHYKEKTGKFSSKKQWICSSVGRAMD